MKKAKFTKKQFEALFPTDDDCLEYIFNKRFINIKECHKCHNPFKYYKLRGLKLYSCQYCGHNLAPTAGTIFHKSSTSLKDWFYSIYLFSVSKNGASGKELQRQLGVTYKCAWRIAHRIRKLFELDNGRLGGIVEMDETYIGGKEFNKHQDKKTPNNQGRSLKTKIAIVGILEREGNIIAKVVTDTSSSIIKPFARKHITIEAEIKTDEYKSYTVLPKIGYSHDSVDHSKKEFVRDEVHTNNLEGFWSQLKRSIHGTYHAVSPKYLQTYVNEFSFRYNVRNSYVPVFSHLLERVALPCP